MYLLQKKQYNIKKTTYQIVYFLFWYVVIKLKALIQFYKIISQHSQIPIYTFLFIFSFNLHIFSLLREIIYIWDFSPSLRDFRQKIVAVHFIRHCEEQSDVAIQCMHVFLQNCFDCRLAMTEE